MRKVVAYCKRHLAQEGHMKEEKSEEELKQTKSYKSLKNWVRRVPSRPQLSRSRWARVDVDG